MSDSLTLSRLPESDACHIQELERIIYELFHDEKACVLLRTMRDYYFESDREPPATDTKAILAWFAKVQYLSDLINTVHSVDEKLHHYNQRG